jgi:hypothetical protein
LSEIKKRGENVKEEFKKGDRNPGKNKMKFLEIKSC